MPKLRLLLGQWGSTVLCQVIEQDESLRSSCGEKILYSCDGFGVASMHHPSLSSVRLSIRGRQSRDDEIRFTHRCSSNIEVTELMAKIRTAVAEINATERETETTDHAIPMEIVE